MKQRAFSLAETAIAMTLLGLILIFLLNLFPTARWAQRSADQKMQAESIANRLLEERLAGGFTGKEVGFQERLPAETIEGVSYLGSFEVLSTPQADPDYLRVYRVRVRWEARGRQHEIVREQWQHRLPHQVTNPE